MSRETLVELTRRTVSHARAGTVPQAADVARVPASNYYDPQRWEMEMERVFRRTPLVLGFSAEFREPNAYKAIEVAGMPVLIVRGGDGELRSFVNMCSHRGAVVVEPGSGTSRRFTCPYHAWSYDTAGKLVGILDRETFGEIDVDCHGLTPLPCAERSGIVFVKLEPNGSMDIDAHLCGYDAMLDHLGIADAWFVGSQTADGPNWKVAYDGYLDFYHLPILHKNTFGPDYANTAIYDAWGPHQRVTSPDHRMLAIGELDEHDWNDRHLTGGVWTIFPHVSIAGFDVRVEGVEGGGRMYMISTLYPGATPDTSITYQNFLATFEPTEEFTDAIAAQRDFLLGVVVDEDYFTGNRIQRALKTGAKPHVIFGRNEAGGQRFHGWVDRVIAAEDDDAFAELFANATTEFQP